jgi:hypothetical protein
MSDSSVTLGRRPPVSLGPQGGARGERFERTVAAAFSIRVADLLAPTRRDASVAFARQCAMYLAHVVFGQSYTEVGRRFGRDRTTASHACRVVEERRDDPLLDALLDVLEDACAAPSPPPAEGEARS